MQRLCRLCTAICIMTQHLHPENSACRQPIRGRRLGVCHSGALDTSDPLLLRGFLFLFLFFSILVFCFCFVAFAEAHEVPEYRGEDRELEDMDARREHQLGQTQQNQKQTKAIDGAGPARALIGPAMRSPTALCCCAGGSRLFPIQTPHIAI